MGYGAGEQELSLPNVLRGFIAESVIAWSFAEDVGGRPTAITAICRARTRSASWRGGPSDFLSAGQRLKSDNHVQQLIFRSWDVGPKMAIITQTRDCSSHAYGMWIMLNTQQVSAIDV